MAKAKPKSKGLDRKALLIVGAVVVVLYLRYRKSRTTTAMDQAVPLTPSNYFYPGSGASYSSGGGTAGSSSGQIGTSSGGGAIYEPNLRKPPVYLGPPAQYPGPVHGPGVPGPGSFPFRPPPTTNPGPTHFAK